MEKGCGKGKTCSLIMEEKRSHLAPLLRLSVGQRQTPRSLVVLCGLMDFKTLVILSPAPIPISVSGNNRDTGVEYSTCTCKIQTDTTTLVFIRQRN